MYGVRVSLWIMFHVLPYASYVVHERYLRREEGQMVPTQGRTLQYPIPYGMLRNDDSSVFDCNEQSLQPLADVTILLRHLLMMYIHIYERAYIRVRI
jgi:hypothetical protein